MPRRESPVTDHVHEQLLESLFDGVYYVDTDRQIVYWNKAAERITGYSRAEVIGRSCHDNILCHVDAEGRNLCVAGCSLVQSFVSAEPQEAEAFLHHKAGHRVAVSLRVSPVFGDTGVVGAVQVFTDISRRADLIQEMEELKRQEMIDPLTLVGNRRFADLLLSNRFQELENGGVPFSVLLIGLDEFRGINDRHGHLVGDRTLKAVAGTLSASLRRLDAVARWGGDEFLVILPNIQRETMGVVARRLQTFVVGSWINVEHSVIVRPTVSIGGVVAMVGDNITSLLGRVDQMLYQCKRSGRNRIAV